MYGYVNRSVFIQKRKFQVSTLSSFKVMIQNVHVQFIFCNSIEVHSDLKINKCLTILKIFLRRREMSLSLQMKLKLIL